MPVVRLKRSTSQALQYLQVASLVLCVSAPYGGRALGKYIFPILKKTLLMPGLMMQPYIVKSPKN